MNKVPVCLCECEHQDPCCVLTAPMVTWCGSGHQRLCQLSLGTCLAVGGWCWHADGCEIRQQAVGRCWRWLDAFKQCQARQQQWSWSTITSTRYRGSGSDASPAASRVMKLCARCGHHSIVVGYVNRHSSSATQSGGIFSQVLSGVFSKR